MEFEEDDESNEIDELNRDIEKNLKLETNIFHNINNIEKFIRKEDFQTIEDTTYHFKQNIERVWNIYKNFEMISILNDFSHFSSIITRGFNTFNEGNIIEGKFFDTYEFHAKVIKSKNYPELKKIEIIFYLENGEILKINTNLYKVTNDDSCVLNFIIKYIPKFGDNIIIQIKSKFKGKELFKKIEDLLEKQPIDLYQYESGIIPGKMEDIWNILTDNAKLVSIAPNNKCFVPININNHKVGEIVNIGMNIKGIEGALEIKLDLKEDKKGWNKWIFGYSILGGQPFKVPKQSVFVQLTRINKIETQLSVSTKIHDPIDNDMFKHLSHKKKYVIYSLKDYFENFYTPNKDDNNEN